jgi:hypothetical protein
VCCIGVTGVEPFCVSHQVLRAGTGLTGGAHRSDRCWSVDSRFSVPLRSRVRMLCVCFRSSGTSLATWAWPIWVVSRRHVLEAVFILLEFPSPSRSIFIGSHSLPPLWFARKPLGSLVETHTSWANKVHMEHLAWMLSQHICERRVRRSYHLGMPTWRTNQLFLKPQPWESSNQIEFTQASQKVKAQVTQLPMPLPQLT